MVGQAVRPRLHDIGDPHGRGYVPRNRGERMFRHGSVLSFAAKLALNEGNRAFHRGEVVSRHFLIINYDVEALLNEHNQFDHPLGVDHIAQQRRIVIERFAAAEKKRSL